jgi:hypothetical protein
MIENGMFFIMKAGCLPVWEDPKNINGGCVSWKVDRKTSYKAWVDTVGHFIMNHFGNKNSLINGVCISPKKNSSIIKIWFSEQIEIEDIKFPESYILSEDKIIYKSHLQNIDKDKQKRQNYSSNSDSYRSYHNNGGSNYGENKFKQKKYENSYDNSYQYEDDF